jgi:hypothetical protein
MPRRKRDKVIWSAVDADEKVLISALAAREGVTLAELLRRAINALAMESGDEAIFIEPRKQGRPRRDGELPCV